MSTYKAAPFDPRFPNQNQTRYCYLSYVDYHRCTKLMTDKAEKNGTDPDMSPCAYFYHVFNDMCPSTWVAKWNEQREEGQFPGAHLINKKAKA